MPEYVNATQAAHLIGVNERSIRYWIAKNQISFTRQSRGGKNDIVISMAEVERIIQERQEKAEIQRAPTTKELQKRIEELQAELSEIRSIAPDLSVILERLDAIEQRLDALEGRQLEAEIYATAQRGTQAARRTSATHTRHTSSPDTALSDDEIERVIIDALKTADGKPRSARQMYQNRAYLRKANQAGMMEPVLARLMETGRVVQAGQSEKGTPFYALRPQEYDM